MSIRCLSLTLQPFDDFCAKRSLLSEALKLNCLFDVCVCRFVVTFMLVQKHNGHFQNHGREREVHLCARFQKSLKKQSKTEFSQVLAHFLGPVFGPLFGHFFEHFFQNLQIFCRFAPPARGLLSSIVTIANINYYLYN